MTIQQSERGDRSPVTIIGLGPMGQALAAAYLQEGRPTTVWNRTPAKADDLVANGAVRANTVADAIAASELVIVCLADYAAMYQLLDSSAAALSGRVLVNLSSGTPDQAREAATWAAKHGAEYLDGAIMVPVPDIGTPEAVILYSGPPAVFQAHQPTLERMAGTSNYLGADPGLAVLYNTALLGFMYATANGFMHSAALVGTAGVSAEEFARLALDWFLPGVVAPIINFQAPRFDQGDHPGDLDTMHTSRTVIDHLVRTSKAHGVNAEVPAFLRSLADQAIAAGHGQDSYSSMFEVMKKAG